MKEKLHQGFLTLTKPRGVWVLLKSIDQKFGLRMLKGNFLERLWESMSRRISTTLGVKELYARYWFFLVA